MLADTSMEMVLRILFLTVFDVDIRFVEKELKEKRYLIAEALPTTQRVGLINKRKFATVAQDKNTKTLLIYVTTLLASSMLVYLFCQAQIGLLLVDKVFTEVPTKYSNYIDVFLFDLVIELSKNTSINKHVIKLVEDKQLPYSLIYSLR